MVDVAPGGDISVPPAEVAEVDLYHAKSFVTKYIFSQDAKVIAIQYSLTAIAGLPPRPTEGVEQDSNQDMSEPAIPPV